MYPSQRSLARKLQGRPVTFVGVNSDGKERLRSTLKREQFDWPNFWDGGDTSGPIAQAWDITGWPTIYVLDHKGIIRFKEIRGDTLELAVRLLVEEIEAGKKK
jgi:hypothetical protein